GSLIRTSQKMHVTQSTITARLKTLEDELGQTLLIRKKSGVVLTPTGVRLLNYARIMTGLWRQAKYETNLPKGMDSVCTFGCNRELWHGLGRAFFLGAISEHREIAITVRQGSNHDLEHWLSTGLVDVVLTFDKFARNAQTMYPLPAENLKLYSSKKNTPVKGDPHYIFVDHGNEYRKAHAEFYHDSGVARLNFNSSWWALQHILEYGGSAYLPQELAISFVKQNKIFELKQAPVFKRNRCLIVNDFTSQNWPWFPKLVHQLSV
ncbi:MAG: LysR family transcriptional regulator, partial [Pseudomonadota bacterium]